MKTCLSLCLLAAALLLPAHASAQRLPEFDFTQEPIAREWRSPHDISALIPTAEGLEVTIRGQDPYFYGPPRNYPADTPLWMTIRLKAEEAGTGEVFYFDKAPAPDHAVRFSVPAGRWTEARVPLPALGPKFQLRIDPPGQRGKVVISSVRFDKRVKLAAPTWPPFPRPISGRRLMGSGSLELFGSEDPLALEFRVGGQSMAFTHPRPRVAYLNGEEVRWIDLASGSVKHEQRGDNVRIITCRMNDRDGGEWSYRQEFRAEAEGTIATVTTVSVNQDRNVVFLPMHLLIAGENSFGTNKNQGLFAGLEYLDNEPSSSEADIVGPEANRRVPASHKITMPLMAIQAHDRYVGLAWEQQLTFSALFDSPDRTFGSGGHALGVLFPGSDGENREEGSLLPYSGVVLKANAPLASRAWILGGAGQSVVPAVAHYVKLRGLPALPRSGLSRADYVTLAAQGWLNSRIRETNFYRHAFWPGFKPQPAADAAVYQAWLATQSTDIAQVSALRDAARGALSVVPPPNYYHSAVSHVRAPVVPLVFGHVAEAIEAARQTARALLSRFEADGSIRYQASATGVDYGKTHFAPDANGLTAHVVAAQLEAAAFCGDRELVGQGITKLRALDKFRNTVPRGAQTWEVPLHTPDILASAHLVRAYTLGYELTGERAFLDQALYWAWTGVPFVYLVHPTEKPVGPYSTIAVLGATQWKAPVWFGQPVQWCGLVYGEALHRLARHDSDGPWKKIADGITIAGLQHTWRETDRERVGLLPDFFLLQAQRGDGPAINPGTVGSGAVRLYTDKPLYDFRALAQAKILIHAPGEIVVHEDTSSGGAFTVRGWPAQPYFVLVNGLARQPKVKIAARDVTPAFDAQHGQVILSLTGAQRVDITW